MGDVLKNRWIQLTASLQLGLLPSLALAGEVPQDWRGVRPMGMGNSFTAVANDENAMFSNPAGLARTRNPRKRIGVHHFSFPEAAIGGNTAAVNAARSSPGNQDAKLKGMVEELKKKPDSPMFYEGYVFPNMSFGGKTLATWHIGFPNRSETKLYYADKTAADGTTSKVATMKTVTTMGASLGVAGTSKMGVFSYGLGIRPNQRYNYKVEDFDLDKATMKGIEAETRAKGTKTTGVGVDAGVIIAAADYWFPTLGLAVRNLPTGCSKTYVNPVTEKTETMCGSLRTGATNSTDPQDLVDPTEVRAGFSLNPRFKIDSEILNVRLHGDAFPLPVKSGTNNYGLNNIHLNKISHAGAELYFGHGIHEPKFAVRVGVNQGYPTYGVSLDIGLSLDYAYYTQDIGGPRGDRKPEGRHLVAISTHW